MIEWLRLDAKQDILSPIFFEMTEKKGLTVHALEEIRPVVLQWLAGYEKDPFSDASLAFLWDTLAPYLQKWGYADDRFRDRWGYIFECDSKSVRRDKILPSTLILTDKDTENRTTLRLSEYLPKGCVAYGIKERGAVVSAAVSHLPPKDGRVEFSVETVPDARKKGYAVSCLAAAVFSLQGGTVAVYRCQRYNAASLQTAKSAGFRPVGKYYRYLGRRKNGV